MKRILFLATVDSHIYQFHLPFMKLLQNMGYKVEVAASNVGFTERIEKEGFKVYNIPFSRNPLSFCNLKASIRLYRIMKENKYIMLHTHTPVASFIGRIVARIVGIPHIVYTAHGFHFHEYGNPLKNFVYYRLEKFAGRFTEALIAINNDDYRIALQKKIASYGKVYYIKGVGVDTEVINPKKMEKQNILNEVLKEQGFEKFAGTVLISVGRLENEKHFGHIIRALSIVRDLNKDFICIIVGDGPLVSKLVDFVNKLTLQENIIFTGYSQKVVGLLNVSHIFVFASSREGLPVSLMEAMAMGKPVVAYNIRGVRDLVEDGVNGFLVPFGDVNGLAGKITYLMEHPEVAEEMGKNGREKIEKEFSLSVILPQMEALYKEILDS